MRYETTGDPMTGLKWSKTATRKIAVELASLNIHVSHKTVGNILKQTDYPLGANHKQLVSGSNDSAQSKEDRNCQFDYIGERREAFAASDNPIISVDAQK